MFCSWLDWSPTQCTLALSFVDPRISNQFRSDGLDVGFACLHNVPVALRCSPFLLLFWSRFILLSILLVAYPCCYFPFPCSSHLKRVSFAWNILLVRSPPVVPFLFTANSHIDHRYAFDSRLLAVGASLWILGRFDVVACHTSSTKKRNRLVIQTRASVCAQPL